VISVDWMDKGACNGMSTDTWYPDFRTQGSKPKRICKQCPVMVECFLYAVETKTRDGIWGGVNMAVPAAVAARKDELREDVS
jgi:transcription factor WhiB